MSISALVKLFEREREAILQGRWSALEALAAEKTRLFDRLNKANPPEEELRRVADLVQRNQHLLKGAMAGTQDAIARLRAVREAQETLRTYDAAGQSSNLAPPARGLERKA